MLIYGLSYTPYAYHHTADVLHMTLISPLKMILKAIEIILSNKGPIVNK